MTRHRLPARWIALVAMLALLLQGAVPLLATAAAQVRGVAVGQVCGLWGVRLPTPAGGDPNLPAAHAAHAAHAEGGESRQDPLPNGASHGHASGCALAALGALAAPAATAAPGTPMAAPQATPRPAARVLVAAPDATATWAARRKQGPPAAA